jgi:hypothetical protein
MYPPSFFCSLYKYILSLVSPLSLSYTCNLMHMEGYEGNLDRGLLCHLAKGHGLQIRSVHRVV